MNNIVFKNTISMILSKAKRLASAIIDKKVSFSMCEIISIIDTIDNIIYYLDGIKFYLQKQYIKKQINKKYGLYVDTDSIKNNP